MSDLKTREFWISDSYLKALRGDVPEGYLWIKPGCCEAHNNKITISFEDRPKTVTISESEFDKIRVNLLDHLNSETISKIKKMLFEGTK